MATLRASARAICIAGSALFLLTACDKLGHDDTGWARAALERNDQITVIAEDKDAKTFTVKEKVSGEIHVVAVADIIGTVPMKGAGTVAAQSNGAPATDASEATARSDAGESNGPAMKGEAARPATDEEARYSAQDAHTAAADNARPGTAFIKNAATGAVLAGSESGNGAAEEASPAPEPSAEKSAGADKSVLASGPGYSIKSGDGAPASRIRLARATELDTSPARGIPLEKRYEPMICQGGRMLHIDNRNLEFEGDAVTAEDGCEIHITNSHIIAHGIGISARAANVHIKNSVIEGDGGSVSASSGAQVYTQSSTFKGLSRRLDTATFHDLGDTVWN